MWWRSSSASSSVDPPANSVENLVDLVGKGEFFLHSLVRGESKGEGARGGFCVRECSREESGHQVRWRSGRPGGGVWHNFSTQRICT
jgi:hypothetical protein